MIAEESLTIAVDFDGTIVEHAYPDIGREMLFAFDTLKALQKKGHKLILWTYREGKYLEDALSYCQDNGVAFYAANKSFPEEILQEGLSRKINADIFIDDRNIGGFPGWGEIFQMLHPNDGMLNHQLVNAEAHNNARSRNNGFKKLLGFPWSISKQKQK